MGETFSTEEQQATVHLVVNGTPKGDVSVAPGATIGSFVVTQARMAGIRTFSVYIDGSKLDTDDSANDVESGSTIEIVAKDSRG